MKAQAGSAGGARAEPSSPQGEAPRSAEAQGTDWDGRVAPTGDDLFDLNDNTERSPFDLDAIDPAPAASPAPVLPPAPRDEKLMRERRATVVSPIPAQLARSMMSDVPGAPAPMHQQPTRPITEAEAKTAGAHPKNEAVDTYSVELIDEPSLPPRALIQSLINRARTFMESGNLGGAVIVADQTLAEAAKAPQNQVADLVKAAGPLFDRIFAAYVGLLGQVPVRMRSEADLVGQELGERTTYLLSHIDGKRTLEEVSTASGIPPVEAMKIAASLLAAGVVRV
jgi:hypothetical protein